MYNKPYSAACEKNKQPILHKIKNFIQDNAKVLEIGSGTGQHAYFFANEFPHISWQTADLDDKHPGINCWITESQHDNILPPLSLDVNILQQWPSTKYDIVYTANTMHIMSWDEVLQMVAMVGQSLNPNGYFICYGPFNVNGKYTSVSNANFDAQLKSCTPHMGIRNLEDVVAECKQYNLTLTECFAMPANNKLLVFAMFA